MLSSWNGRPPSQVVETVQVVKFVEIVEIVKFVEVVKLVHSDRSPEKQITTLPAAC